MLTCVLTVSFHKVSFHMLLNIFSLISGSSDRNTSLHRSVSVGKLAVP